MQKIEVEIQKKKNNQPTVKASAGFGMKFTTDGEETVSSFYALSTKYSVPQNYNYEI